MEGAGLGSRFLRHIERTALLVHLVAPPEGVDALEEPELAAAEMAEHYRLVRKELEGYSETLAGKGEVVVVSKVDRMSAEALEGLRAALAEEGLEAVVPVSSHSGAGLETLRSVLGERLEAMDLVTGE